MPHDSCQTSFQSRDSRGNGERKLCGCPEEVPGSSLWEAFYPQWMLPLQKSMFLKKITERNSGSWKRRNPENEKLEDASFLECNLARLKNKEPYTECPFFFWFWHHFPLNTGLDRPKTAAKAISLSLRERTGNVNCDTKRIVCLLRGILGWNVQVFVVSVLTLFLLFWLSFHTFLNYSRRLLKVINFF